MAVAMLLYVRATLLEGDYTSTLRRLLKYPPVEHVHTLVERALQLRRAFGADANGEPAVAGGFPITSIGRVRRTNCPAVSHIRSWLVILHESFVGAWQCAKLVACRPCFARRSD